MLHELEGLVRRARLLRHDACEGPRDPEELAGRAGLLADHLRRLDDAEAALLLGAANTDIGSGD
jgi:hypothetical protein